MPKVTQQYLDARREQILNAARRCFLRDGFHATSMQDLFAESGLSSGAVYRYFAGKDEMVLAIAEENMRDVLATMHAVAIREPGRSVGAAMADALEIIRAKSAGGGFGGLAVLVWAEALRNPSLARRLDDLLAQMRADLAEVVREHQNAGGLPQDVTADAVATTLICILPGYILQLAVIGASAVEAVPDAVRALWPSSAAG
ncbi:TetR/AcrR family transcriptional regulator [Streptomyces sp. NBC_00344]|uniref:TetR/AcrR family transcriptional regulator n=1 Tax=Streptomyces sp. NBC_00344 TaxID=2975720 RepID=UPI002E2071FD